MFFGQIEDDLHSNDAMFDTGGEIIGDYGCSMWTEGFIGVLIGSWS